VSHSGIQRRKLQFTSGDYINRSPRDQVKNGEVKRIFGKKENRYEHLRPIIGQEFSKGIID
jgi:hypothetical protein